MNAEQALRAAVPVGVGIVTALEVHALRNGHHERTLSRWVRWLFHTETAAGRVTLCSGWVALTFWFLPHICNGPHDERN